MEGICSVNFSSQLFPPETGYPRLWSICSLVLGTGGKPMVPLSLCDSQHNSCLHSSPTWPWIAQGAHGAAATGDSCHLPPWFISSPSCSLPLTGHFLPWHNTELGIWQRNKGNDAAPQGCGERKTAFYGDWWLFWSSTHLDELHCSSRGVTSAVAGRTDRCSPFGHSSLLPSHEAWMQEPEGSRVAASLSVWAISVPEVRTLLPLPFIGHICIFHSHKIALAVFPTTPVWNVAAAQGVWIERWIVCIYPGSPNLGYSCYDNWIFWFCKSVHTNSQ